MAEEKPHMIRLELSHDTHWTTLEPLMPPRDFSNTSPYHIHETSPVPLGSESARPACRGDCYQGREECEHPDVCVSDFVTLPAEVTSKRMEPMAWVIAVPLTCIILYAGWQVLAGLWSLFIRWSA